MPYLIKFINKSENGNAVCGTFTTTGAALAVNTGQSVIYHVTLLGTTGSSPVLQATTTNSMPTTTGGFTIASSSVSGTFEAIGQ